MIGLLVAVTMAAGAPDAAKPMTDRQLIARIEQLHEQCREAAGPSEARYRAVMGACGRRDALVEQAHKRGWCWGPVEAIEADRRWMRVGPTCRN